MARSGATGVGGGALPAGGTTAGHVHVQACPHPGGGVSVAPQEHAAAVPPAHCPGIGGGFSRDHGHAPRTAGPALHGSGSPGRSATLLAPGRATAGTAVRFPSLSDPQPFASRGPARDNDPRRTRVRKASLLRTTAIAAAYRGHFKVRPELRRRCSVSRPEQISSAALKRFGTR